MNTDIRVKIGFRRHHKTLQLERTLGAKAVLDLIELWCWAAMYRPRGSLALMSNSEIATAAGWPEDRADEFVKALTEARFLDRKKTLHDWPEHQAFVYHAPERSKSAKVASSARWHNNNGHAARNAERIPKRYAKRNPPSPIPSPNPDLRARAYDPPQPKDPDLHHQGTDQLRSMLGTMHASTKMENAIGPGELKRRLRSKKEPK